MYYLLSPPINIGSSQTVAIFAIGMSIIISYISLSMYESNALQFGMDQMLEASSEQLSSFIHWYFWCIHLGQVMSFYVFVIMYILSHNCTIKFRGTSEYGYLFSYLGLIGSILLPIQIVLSVTGIIINICYKKMYRIELTSRNRLHLVLKVLKYAYDHKYPLNRSAFTYWENDIPSRIDLGKQKYGGPFTYEQVEDVKTMLRLILMMLSLFGYHLLGDGFSFTNYLMKTFGCPEIYTFTLIVINPQHILSLVVLIGIPCYCLAVKKYKISMYFTMIRRI